jgi:hypothetical protein
VLPKRDRHLWPSPFRALGRRASPLPLAPDTGLVHVASLYGIYRATRGISSTDVLDAISDQDDDFIDLVLDNWWHQARRSVFAALASDIEQVLERARSGNPGWPDEMRDRMGLVHHDPLSSHDISIVVFRYRVADVPRAEGLGTDRPVVAPSAIDSNLNQAFCPVAQAGMPGRCVDLRARADPPIREVLHPCPRFRPDHILAVGDITLPVPDLVDARWTHLEILRSSIGPTDFGSPVDDDLAS